LERKTSTSHRSKDTVLVVLVFKAKKFAIIEKKIDLLFNSPTSNISETIIAVTKRWMKFW